MKFIKIFQVTALALSIAACGGGSGSGSGSGSSSSNTPSKIEGTASKGIISGATVEAYEVLADGKLSEKPVGFAKTATDGKFSITLDSTYKGGALRVVTKGGNGAEMVCDIPAGCGEILFGNKVALPSTFELAAVIAQPTGNTVNVNINALTHLADQLASKNGYSKDKIANSNDIIRQAFQLPQDITTAIAVDVTQASAINKADDFSKRVALLSAGLLAEVTLTQEKSDFVDAFTTFTNKVKTDGGIILNDTDLGTISSVADIVEQSLNVIDKVSKDAKQPVELDTVEQSLQFSSDDLEAKDQTDKIADIKPVISNTNSNVAQAKALAADIRMLATSATGEIDDGLNNFEDKIRGAFGSEKELVDSVANENLAELTDAATEAASAFEAAAREYSQAFDNDDTLPTQVTTNGLIVKITRLSSNDKNPQFSLKQTLDGQTYDLTATVLTDYQETNTPEKLDNEATNTNQDIDKQTITGDATVSMAGRIENSSMLLNITNAKVELTGVNAVYTDSITLSGSGIDSDSRYEEFYIDDVKVKKINLILDATISQKLISTVSDPVSFNGKLELVLDNVDSVSEEFYKNEYIKDRFSKFTNGDNQTITATNLSLKLNGTVSDSKESVDANFVLTASNPDGINFKTSFEETYGGESYSLIESDESNETEAKFIQAKAQLIISAKLIGIKTPAVLTFNAERTGLEDATATAIIQYDGKAITVEASKQKADKSRDVTIKNGTVTMTANVPDEGDWSGDVFVNNEKVGKIEEARDGLIIIRYNDGSFESVI